ncbi:hypothetical protein [Pantoea endophytica]|uniref:hypothetical protein n=1 Tax=Pantoea endophytica TaxID=92488 RepID=UPI0024137F45|nr:hypothetical protein [Pantoea endophytica]
MAKLKIGSVALVVKTYRIHENLGRSVVIERIINHGKGFRSPKTHRIIENQSGEFMYLATGSLKNPFQGEDGWGLFHKEQLMPIDGEEFQPETEQEKELII